MEKQKNITTIEKKFAACLLAILFTFFSFLSPNKIFAQDAISLSVSPPITEVVIMPGKEFKADFTISNTGGGTVLTPKIVQFLPVDDFGNVELTDRPGPDWVKYHTDPFSLASGESKNISVLISPPENAPEIDHYLSLVFETKQAADLTSDNLSFYRASIATNILITVSKDGNPKRLASITSFKGPEIIDSIFGNLSYKVVIKNVGNYFWKPIGKITVNKGGSSQTLNLAPQNIISGSAREISCLENENLIPCKVEKGFLLGRYVANLEFSLDDTPDVYKETITTFAFPFSLIGAFILIIPLLRLTKRIKNLIFKKRKKHD